MVKLNYNKSLKNLEQVINNRTVAIVLPGPSVEGLKHVGELDVCWATVNDFWVMEQFHKMDIIMCSAKECNVPDERHLEFLERQEKNAFVTEAVSFHKDLEECLDNYSDKLVFFNADRSEYMLQVPNKSQPMNFLAQASFSILIGLCIASGASRIVLFGADGGRVGEELYLEGWDSDSEERLNHDTQTLNATMAIVLQNVYRTYEVEPVEIINCSIDSKYTVFPRYTYEETIEKLQRG